MTTLYGDELEVAPPAVVRQVARDFAAALASTAEFQALEEAAATLLEDATARQAMFAYQEKQRSLQGLLMLGALSIEEQTELEQLRQTYLQQPAAASYLRAETTPVHMKVYIFGTSEFARSKPEKKPVHQWEIKC